MSRLDAEIWHRDPPEKKVTVPTRRSRSVKWKQYGELITHETLVAKMGVGGDSSLDASKVTKSSSHKQGDKLHSNRA